MRLIIINILIICWSATLWSSIHSETNHPGQLLNNDYQPSKLRMIRSMKRSNLLERQQRDLDVGVDLAPPIKPRIHKKKHGAKSGAGFDGTAPENITYHGGPVISKPVIYLICPWWAINRKYNNTAAITYGGSTTNNYSNGTNLTDATIYDIVIKAINAKKLPNNTNGVYLVLTSSDCTQTWFCSQACAWHTSNGPLKYGWAGDPTVLCPAACSFQSPSPNGNIGADAVVNVAAHEAAETVSDPDGNAWYDADGNENADKCAWTFGTTYTVSNGAQANMKINGYNYLVQQLWKLSTQSCGLS